MDVNTIRIISPHQLRGTIALPASKSISNRALVISALAGADMQRLSNISDCDDSKVVVRALEQLTLHPREEITIDIMAAGTAMRFLTAYLAVTPGTRIITGTERMQHRPISVLVDALRQLGAQVEYVGEEGFPPLRISGRKLAGGTISLPGSVSSQYISALLMIGPMLEQGLELQLTGDVISRPYIEMTLSIMRQFGAKASWLSDSNLQVEAGGYCAIPYFIESDWSAASYWYQMVALSSDGAAEVRLPGLFSSSLQGDSAGREIFERLGVQTEFYVDEQGVEGVIVRKQGTPCDRLEWNLVNQPDLAQTFVATCCAMNVPFRFTGLQSLKIKETDRINALRTELGKLGYVVGEENDSVLYWDGAKKQPIGQVAIDTYEDHRMAMSFAPLCMISDGICINDPQVVSKSYPTYWEHLKQVGFNVE